MATATMTEREAHRRSSDYRKEGYVAVFELDDPPANTYTHEMMRQLDDCILRARFDNDVHVIVIRGAGEKFFCAGANIKMLNEADPIWKYYFCLHANETLSRLEQTPKLVIAALNGHCVGGGLEIAMAADIRIARAEAGKIGLPEVNLGVLPGTGGTQRLARLIGKAKAIELMVTGAPSPSRKPRSWGSSTRCFRRTTGGTTSCSTRSSSRCRTRRPWRSATSSARCSRGSRCPSSTGLAARARAAAPALQERGREGRARGVRREAAAALSRA